MEEYDYSLHIYKDGGVVYGPFDFVESFYTKASGAFCVLSLYEEQLLNAADALSFLDVILASNLKLRTKREPICFGGEKNDRSVMEKILDFRAELSFVASVDRAYAKATSLYVGPRLGKTYGCFYVQGVKFGFFKSICEGFAFLNIIEQERWIDFTDKRILMKDLCQSEIKNFNFEIISLN